MLICVFSYISPSHEKVAYYTYFFALCFFCLTIYEITLCPFIETIFILMPSNTASDNSFSPLISRTRYPQPARHLSFCTAQAPQAQHLVINVLAFCALFFLLPQSQHTILTFMQRIMQYNLDITTASGQLLLWNGFPTSQLH